MGAHIFAVVLYFCIVSIFPVSSALWMLAGGDFVIQNNSQRSLSIVFVISR